MNDAVPDPRAELRALTSGFLAHAELDALLGLNAVPMSAPTAPAAEPVPPRRAAEPAPRRAPPPAAQPAPRRAAPPAAQPPSSAPADDAGLAQRRAESEQKLGALARRMAGCTRCKLSEGRTNLVFGQGDAVAEIAFVGEGPGRNEDERGLAFCGPSGDLLTKMIQAMGIERGDAFICNVVKCRPPGNRNPQPDEMGTCLPFLREQLSIVRPKVIVALGKTAAVGLGLLAPNEGLGRNRGRELSWEGIPVILTYHPAYLLRTPADKRKTWQDLQRAFPYLSRRKV